MSVPVDWLPAGEPWLEYHTRLDLLGQSEKDAQVQPARTPMLANAQVCIKPFFCTNCFITIPDPSPISFFETGEGQGGVNHHLQKPACP